MKRLNGGYYQISLNQELDVGDNMPITNEEDVKHLSEIGKQFLNGKNGKNIHIAFNTNGYGTMSFIGLLRNLGDDGIEVSIYNNVFDIKIIISPNTNTYVYFFTEL